MKLIEYEMKTSKTDNKNIVVCSDISKSMSNRKFDNILKVFTDIKPTHIILPEFYDINSLKTRNFIINATQIADVLYVGDNFKLVDNNPKFHLFSSTDKIKYMEANGISITSFNTNYNVDLLFYYRECLDRILSSNNFNILLCDSATKKFLSYFEMFIDIHFNLVVSNYDSYKITVNDIINRPGIFHGTTIENVKILRK